MRERLRNSRGLRIGIVGVIFFAFLAGCIYLFFHNPVIYPIPCIFHVLTGLYCPGCGAGRACFALLHGHFLEAFAYNPLLFLLLPFIGLYLVVRCADWMITGGNHVDRRISVKMLVAVLIVVFVYGMVRNIPVYPFTLLAPGGILMERGFI